MHTLICNLPYSLENVIASISGTTKVENLKLDEIVGTSKINIDLEALVTMAHSKEWNGEIPSGRKSRYRGRYGNKGGKMQELICWMHHQRGHKKDDCKVDPLKKKEVKKRDLVATCWDF